MPSRLGSLPHEATWAVSALPAGPGQHVPTRALYDPGHRGAARPQSEAPCLCGREAGIECRIAEKAGDGPPHHASLLAPAQVYPDEGRFQAWGRGRVPGWPGPHLWQ